MCQVRRSFVTERVFIRDSLDNDNEVIYFLYGAISMYNKKINRLSYTDYGVGLHFKQRLFSHLFLMVNTGYTFYRKLEFKRNSKSVFDTKSKDKMFIKAGVSFMM